MTPVFEGLSPRVRGNRGRFGRRRWGKRSIPACTGEPDGHQVRRREQEVYPRVYGGTCVTIGVDKHLQGLSPRVRGNLARMTDHETEDGSIPACTGEPVGITPPPRSQRVYPRVYGGTILAAFPTCAKGGLSPRVRGNQVVRNLPDGYQRSIPACTGEPRLAGHIVLLQFGSIPACTGEPSPIPMLLMRMTGLSPRVRGNPMIRILRWRMRRSIPACTGEPLSAPATRKRVYPRVYGGTAPSAPVETYSAGLSPRVRGNRRGRSS